MSDFKKIQQAVHRQLDEMASGDLFQVELDKDYLWNTYLGNFPPGTNLIHRERTEHDCQCCKGFIRKAGGIVSIVDNELVSIWDIDIGGYYQVVADALSDAVKSEVVEGVFLSKEKHLGVDHNFEDLGAGNVKRWDHFHYALPHRFVCDSVAATKGKKRADKEVLKRGLDEITMGSVETVIELIEQNSLYRGEEHRSILRQFSVVKIQYDKLESGHDNYCWKKASEVPHVARMRNSVIGTLLVDLSNGVDLNVAVKSFEDKVAPENYKRPTALITKAMIEKAEAKVTELGLKDSLERRYAVASDITVNNVLFADRSVKPVMGGVFEEMKAAVPDKPGNLDKVEAVDVDTFIRRILPHADSVEVMLENMHTGNLMSLLAPVHKDSAPMLSWGNNFSWTYNGEVTDSIKEKVKRAGGLTDAVLRYSIAWHNYDDLDAHAREKPGSHIYFPKARQVHPSTGVLDVDMNAGGRQTREAVENIVWTDERKIPKSILLQVHQYQKREAIDVGFDAEIEVAGQVHSFHYEKTVSGTIDVATITNDGGLSITPHLPYVSTPKQVWGVTTQKFHKATMIMDSPNHWDGHKTGNRHLFFILGGCKQEGKARGFFNEFLRRDLVEHRKVFEVLGSKMKAAESVDQLSGLGFSSTQRNEVLCRVSGSFNRTIKVQF